MNTHVEVSGEDFWAIQCAEEQKVIRAMLAERDALRAEYEHVKKSYNIAESERIRMSAQAQELLEALEKIVIIASTRKADHRLCTLEIADAALAKVTP